MTIQFHAVMLDECGMEFGVTVRALNHGEASDILGEQYPESRVIQLESPEETAERERQTYLRAYYEIDNDCDYDEFYDDELDEDYLAEHCLN